MPACARPGTYVPRRTHACDAAVLVCRHLAGFLARIEERGQGWLPDFVKAELEGFAGCGDFELGFVRTACRRCGDELRVPFACKSRGFCPSCMGRRMAEGRAARRSRAARGGLPTMGAVIPGAAGRAPGLRPITPGHGRGAPRSGGDAGHATVGETAARPRLGDVAARRSGRGGPALSQRPRPGRPSPLSGHRRAGGRGRAARGTRGANGPTDEGDGQAGLVRDMRGVARPGRPARVVRRALSTSSRPFSSRAGGGVKGGARSDGPSPRRRRGTIHGLAASRETRGAGESGRGDARHHEPPAIFRLNGGRNRRRPRARLELQGDDCLMGEVRICVSNADARRESSISLSSE